jgi:hypothetical protein
MHEHPDQSHSLGLLPARHHRPRRRAAAPPSNVMNSRRFMCCLNPRIAAYHSGDRK